MDLLSYPELILFVVTSFAASLIAGLAGFAFGLIAAAFWLHLLPVAQTTGLIVGFALVIQGYAVWKLRHAIRYSRLMPFIIGGMAGVPLGVLALQWLPPASLRSGVGVLLIAYSIYALVRPTMPGVAAGGRVADTAVGVVGGALGGATGLGGILATIWCSMRGWPKDEQRAVFQPVAVAIFVMTAFWLGSNEIADWKTGQLFLIGLPGVLLGSWAGLKLYGRLGQSAFNKVILVLLLVSGALLL